MANKVLNTRIQLKYDSWGEWSKVADTFKPLMGEVCIVNPGENGTSCLLKVGNGSSLFKDLPWVSALAADVHAWAKAENVAVVGDGNAITNAAIVDDVLTFTKGETFATKAELEALADEVETIDTNTNTEYRFEIVEGVLNVYKTVSELGVAGAETLVGTYDFITSDELNNVLADYVTLEVYNAHLEAQAEIDAEQDRRLGVAEEALKNVYTKEEIAGLDHATKTYVDEELAKKQNTIPENTYDAYGAAEGVKNYADGQFATKVALGEEVTRATGIEAGLRTDVDAVRARVEAFLDNTGAATDAIDTLQELLTYIDEHDDVEIADIIADIKKLQDKTVLGTYADGEETKEYATVKAYVEAVVAALEGKITAAEGAFAEADAALKAELQKEIDDDVKALAEGAVADNTAAITAINNETTGILATAKAYTNDEIAKLDKEDTAVENQYVTAVSEENGIITVSRKQISYNELADIPEAIKASGAATIATVADGVVTLKAGAVLGEDHVLANGTGADITLNKIATTGKLSDLECAVEEYVIFNCGSATIMADNNNIA